MKRIRAQRAGAVWTLSLLVALAAGCGTSDSSTDDPGQIVQLGSGDDRLPNESASDLVTFADHVLVVTVDGEEEQPVPKEDLDRGEGLVPRKVHLTVDNVLWSNAGASPAPHELDWGVLGWRFKKSLDNRTVAAMGNAPRFEVGHSYIVAVDWEQSSCNETGRWTPLGGSFDTPYEDDTIGVGEFEGRVIDASHLKTTTPRGDGLRADLWGQSADDLVTALERARPDESLAQQLKTADPDC